MNSEIQDFEFDDDFQGEISVIGAREHNLKNISVTIPRDKITVITGLSGSGKSSLAFDTIFAEGQRRYVECLSAYARQFLGMMKKPEVDSIEGLSPAISIEQKTLGYNPRSTVGTVTEIYDYIRVLFARVGIQYSIEANLPVVEKKPQQIVDEIIQDFIDFRAMILAPIVKARKGHYKELFDQLMKQGFTKVRVDGEIIDMKEGMQVARYKIHDIDLLVDRLKIAESERFRIAESVKQALNRGDEAMTLIVEQKDGTWLEKMFSTNYSCPVSGRAYEKLAPNMFSFNSPYGACKTCGGLGEVYDLNPELIIPDKSLSFTRNACDLVGPKKRIWIWRNLEDLAYRNGIELNKPVCEYTESEYNILMFGNVSPVSKTAGGLMKLLRDSYETEDISANRKKFETYMEETVCPDCKGGRLKPESLNVFLGDKNIKDITLMSVLEAKEYFEIVPTKLNKQQLQIGNLAVKEITERLQFLDEVGLGYLSLGRAAKTLSGGEAQRIRLASQIGSKLVGVTYVLDEPSIGLHQHDNFKLINSLKNLRDLGNTLVVVEHDKAMIEESDYFIDMGPGAGVHGGEVVLAKEMTTKITKKDAKNSLTAGYMIGTKKIEYRTQRREGNGNSIVLSGATGNNLRNVTLNLPLGKLICITGMSGSGKSTLINDTLYPILSRRFHNAHSIALPYQSIEGLENIDKVIEIDQKPIGRTPRSNPSTYTGLFTHIRDLYAILPESKIRGYKPGRFSFNMNGGRCEACEGAGMQKIEMNFLPQVYVTCDECQGKRYNKETLSIKYKGKSIADVLGMTVEEALDFFKDIPKIQNKIETLNAVGLGYITLGQQAPTLSGGEAQRVKLATELAKRGTGKTLYLLDEPTTGLHFEDIRILQQLIDKLVDRGNTVIIIEHNLDVIKCADWIIDLGPMGGSQGGEIVAEGTPEKIAKSKRSLTGKYLKTEL